MKQTEKAGRKQIAAGAAAAMALYLPLLALLALLAARGTVGEGAVNACVCACACVAAFVGAKTAAWHRTSAFAPSAVCAAVFWALLVALGFLVNDAVDPARAMRLAVSVCAGGALACLGRGGGKKRGNRKRRSRK